MIELIKAEDYRRCNACGSNCAVSEIKLGLNNASITSTTLCKRCLSELLIKANKRYAFYEDKNGKMCVDGTLGHGKE